ncbi:hypothetical protein J5N97_002548 [Dioscorea zingiberensis]|uniref:Homeobox domain-containing protein n=1 Tax=Dioscorea zingiberensis TaxID=325984 RepID=A0A9D5D4H6_9LILI|nr:hypothetical protein J5N97_002548 [Dioscorea zingiberensis]
MEEEKENISLSLSIGRGHQDHDLVSEENHGKENKQPVQLHVLFPPPLESNQAEEEDDQTGGGNAPRKKLRLTKEQSDMLENSFRENAILNGNQKQELARRLDLQVRQVEVWFQNRRARTKLKKTEVECEFLKRYCQSLNEENRRLKRELQALKLPRPSSPLLLQLSKQETKNSTCPACMHSEAEGHGKSTASLDSGSEKSRIYSC